MDKPISREGGKDGVSPASLCVTRQHLAASSSEPQQKEAQMGASGCRCPSHTFSLPPFSGMPYWLWLGPKKQALPGEASPLGPMQGSRKDTLTNFLSISALMSLARVKNACGMSVPLVPRSGKQTGPAAPGHRYAVGVAGQWGRHGEQHQDGLLPWGSPVQPQLLPRPGYPCPPGRPAPLSQ